MNKEIEVEQWSDSIVKDLVAFYKPRFGGPVDVSKDVADKACKVLIMKLLSHQEVFKRFVIRSKTNRSILAVIHVWADPNHCEITSTWADGITPEDKDALRQEIEVRHISKITSTPKTIWWWL